MQSAVVINFVLLVLAALGAFRLMPPRRAALTVFFLGWLLAPVGLFPPAPVDGEFPFWIVGGALPSEMIWQKAWMVPCVVLAAVVVFDSAALRSLRPTWFDALMIAWCVWPVVQSLFVDDPRPSGVVAALYLVATWGTTWCIGRVYCRGVHGRLDLLRALALAGLACLPFALVEGMFGVQAYGRIFGEPHPFRDDGFTRYLGWRPIGFFEHGNQYGIWVALSALAASWLAWRQAEHDRRWRWIALGAIGIAVAAQSVGALLLALIGGAAFVAAAYQRPRRLVLVPLVIGVLLSAIYVSGAIPVARIANETAVGRAVVDAIKATGRGSFTWRIAQDQRALPLVAAQPIAGAGQWDWWRSIGSRPWGLAMLTLGQFGAIGLVLSAGALLAPALRTAWNAPTADPRSHAAHWWLLSLLVLLSALDALLNSFVYMPALLIAGALASADP